MGVSVFTDNVQIEGKGVSVLQAHINTAVADTTQLVAAVTGKKIRVTAVTVICAGAQTITFKSAATALGGAYSFAANGGMDVDRTPPNWFLETSAGEALNYTTTQAVQTSGSINYVLV
jgi:hypothetical protein